MAALEKSIVGMLAVIGVVALVMATGCSNQGPKDKYNSKGKQKQMLEDAKKREEAAVEAAKKAADEKKDLEAKAKLEEDIRKVVMDVLAEQNQKACEPLVAQEKAHKECLTDLAAKIFDAIGDNTKMIYMGQVDFNCGGLKDKELEDCQIELENNILALQKEAEESMVDPVLIMALQPEAGKAAE